MSSNRDDADPGPAGAGEPGPLPPPLPPSMQPPPLPASLQPTSPASPPAGAPTRRRWGPVVAVLALLALGIGVVLVVTMRGGDSPASTAVRLESADQPGQDPFTDSVAIGPVVEFPGNVKAVNASVRDGLAVDPVIGVRSGDGTTPGLYGGSSDRAVCDPAKLVRFLAEHPAKAAAWAAVFGIDPDGIERYVEGLTPVVLSADTVVTNHGFRGGRANSFTAVLQAGTAVLVDATGVPRVKCNCGNPLAPAPARSIATAPTVGRRWPGFSPSDVVVVRPGASTGSLTVTDIVSGEPVSVPVAAPSSSAPSSAPSSSTTSTVAAGGDLRSVDWKNHTYSLTGCGAGSAGESQDLSFRNGTWTSGDGLWGARETGEQYGDLDGDAHDDVLVSFECFAVGGNANPGVVSVAFSAGGSGPTPLGATIAGASPTVADGGVKTTDPVWTDRDPRCCPSSSRVTMWRYGAGGWTPT